MILLLAIAVLASSNDLLQWHEMYSLSCMQLKIESKGKRSVPFKLYQAANRGAKCCDDTALIEEGKTSRFGYFKVKSKLQLGGNYYLVFNNKGKELVVGMEMKNNYVDQNCSEYDTVIHFDKNDKPEVLVTVTVN